jgi:phage terminase large subunit-like protein
MGRDKLARSIDAQNRMERGKIWLPEQAGWLDDFEIEVFGWTAHPDEQDDQIDTLSNAALYVSSEACGSEVEVNGGLGSPMAFSIPSRGFW